MPAYARELPKPPRCGDDHCSRPATHQVYDTSNSPLGAPRCERHAAEWVTQINARPFRTRQVPRHF